jgi:starvation-inducible DNA-binding protein
MLADNLKELLATTYSYKIKAQAFHWNIEGSNFPQYHEFLGEIYEDADSAIDPLAEYIRTLDVYAPGSFKRFSELSKIEDQLKVPKAELMLKELLKDTETLLALLKDAFDVATTDREQGIANFLADRITSHGKYKWQLSATLK